MGRKGPTREIRKVFMKYVLRRVTVMMVLFFSMGLLKASDEWYQETSEQLYADAESGGRSYHGATHDMITGGEHNPFMFTTSSLGHSLRATSSLLGHVYAAVEESSVREQLMENMDDFCENILNLYVLCHEAVRSVECQLDDAPERSGYLLEHVEHLHQRVLVLSDYFGALVENAQSHEISTVLVTLNMIVKKTGRMLAL